MFYKQIERKCAEWFDSPLLEYACLYDKQGRKLSNELEDEILGHSDAEVKIEPDCTVRIGGGGKNRMLWDGIIQTLDDRCPLRMRIRNICGDESTYIFNP